jgi:hypothetical protein
MTTATRKRPRGADAPAPSPKRFVLTASAAREARQKREEIHDFELTHTMPGAFARVRLVDLQDPEILTNALPARLLAELLETVREVEGQEAGGEARELSVIEKIDLARKNMHAIVAYCIAGFVEPPLILSEDDRDPRRDDEVVVTDIDARDRQRFFDWCQGRYEEASATVLPFPQGSASTVDAGGPGGASGGASEPTAESSRDGDS